MPATGCTTSSSRNSVSRSPPPPPPPSPPRSRRRRSRNRRPRRPPRPSSSSSALLLLALLSRWSRGSGCPADRHRRTCRRWSLVPLGVLGRRAVGLGAWSRPACLVGLAGAPAWRDAPAALATLLVGRSVSSFCRRRPGCHCRPRRAHRLPDVASAELDSASRPCRSTPAAFTDSGDEFALAHSGRTFDADLLGKCPQFGQHHGGERSGAIARRHFGRRCGFPGGRAVRALSSAGVELSEFTGFCSSAFSPLPPAVMRSVSVTDFLSFPH